MTQKLPFLGVVVSMSVAFSFGLFVPLVYKNFIDLASQGIENAGILEQLYHWGYIFIALILIQQAWWKSLEYWIIPFETRICRQIYDDSMSRMIGQSNRFFTQHFSGSIVRTISRLVDTTEWLIDMFVYQIGRLFFSIIIQTAILLYTNVYLGIGFFIWMISVIFVKKILWTKKLKLHEVVAQESTKISARLSDIFTNALTVITCGMNKKEIIEFRGIVSGWYKVWQKSWWFDYGIFFVTTIFIVTLQIGTIFWAIYLWSTGQITVGTFVLLVVYLSNFIDQAVDVNFLFRNIYRSGADMTEAIDVLNTPREINDIKDAQKLSIKKSEIIFKDVTFSYDENTEEVLQNFNLTIHSGEKIALVGLSGSWKSTVLKLLFRLYDVTGGEILIDGQNIAYVTQESLRQSLSMVPQDPILFHRTIAENIAYAAAGNAHQKDIEIAAKHAFAHDFITKLPHKYETIVGERWVKLSGGERQRVALARAILANKSILVFDEATSSLDSESEKYIQEWLHDVMMWRTSIVIAHRLSTIMQMDRIIVMGEWKILEEWTHDSLLKKKNGAYKKLWDIQTGEFIKDA